MTHYRLRLKDAIIGLQFLFVAFGALVLVPILTGLNPNVALFTAGLGTLIFQLTTRRKIPPIFLASSFAFIAPIIYGVGKWGIAATMSGLAAAGLFYVLLSFLIRWRGNAFIHRLLPPIVTGPVIMTIGLILAPVAVQMATGHTGDGNTVLVPFGTAITVSMITLLATILATLLGKGMVKLLPILIGIVVGYLASIMLGIVDFSAVKSAPLFAIPDFTLPKLNWEAILYIVPIAIAPAVEHIGDILAISRVTGHDYLKDPGLENSLLGDGLATTAAALLGGPPNTTYSEVTGAVSITKAFNPAIMTWSSIFAILLAFFSKLGGFLQTIPAPVMGGILLLLFGIIASVGMNTLIHAKVDLSNPRNMIIVSLILVFAIGGMSFRFGGVGFSGIGLGAILGIFLNLTLPKGQHEDLPMDKYAKTSIDKS